MRVPSGSWFRCSRRRLLLWFRRGGECSFVLPVWVGCVFVFVEIDVAFIDCFPCVAVVAACFVSPVPCFGFDAVYGAFCCLCYCGEVGAAVLFPCVCCDQFALAWLVLAHVSSCWFWT